MIAWSGEQRTNIVTFPGAGRLSAPCSMASFTTRQTDQLLAGVTSHHNAVMASVLEMYSPLFFIQFMMVDVFPCLVHR